MDTTSWCVRSEWMFVKVAVWLDRCACSSERVSNGRELRFQLEADSGGVGSAVTATIGRAPFRSRPVSSTGRSTVLPR